MWSVESIGDQSGRVVVVTGANSGIGLETARTLFEKGARVYLACRSLEKGEKARKEIIGTSSSGEAKVAHLDLADLASVKSFVESFTRDEPRLDLLINNAGVMTPPLGRTAQGFELQMGTNHLGHFALTSGLIDSLFRAKSARVVVVSSLAHKWGRIDLDDLHWERRKYKRWRAYGDSKLANLLFTLELQRRLKVGGHHTVAVSAHPGWTNTNLQKNIKVADFFNPILAQNPLMGALPTLRAACDVDSQGGDFYGPKGVFQLKGYPEKVKADSRALDMNSAADLWSISEELTETKLL